MDGSGGSKKPSPFTHIPLDRPKERFYRRFIVRNSSTTTTTSVLPSTHDMIQLQRELQLFNVRAQGRALQLELGDECLRSKKLKDLKTPPPQGHAASSSTNSSNALASASHKKDREKTSHLLHQQQQPDSKALEKKQKFGGGIKLSGQDTMLRHTPEKIVVKLKIEPSTVGKDSWTKALPSEDDDFIPPAAIRKQKSRTPVPNPDPSVAKRKRKSEDSGDDFGGFSENEKSVANPPILGSTSTSHPSQKTQSQRLAKSSTSGQSSSHVKKRKVDATIPSVHAAVPHFAASEMQIAPSVPPTADGNPLNSTSTPSAAGPDDFPRVKVANQVPIQTFYTSIEPYFRPVTEEDLHWLEQKEDDVTPQLIPPLGRNYLDVWSKADQTISAVFSDSSAHSSHDSARRRLLANNHHNHAYTSHGDANVSSNNSRAQSEVSNDDHSNVVPSSYVDDGCGPLTARILCSLLEDAVVPRRDGASEKAAGDSDAKFEAGDEVIEDEKAFFSGLKERQLARAENSRMERRLKEELQFIGLLDDDDINWASREDDEISVTLRKLQRELEEQVRLNRLRKQQVLVVAKSHMGYQEYNNALDELDKQVEAAFVKRFRPVKGTNKKKKSLMTPSCRAIIDQAVASIDRRQRFINGVGCIFPAEKFKVPKGSIFRDGAS